MSLRRKILLPFFLLTLFLSFQVGVTMFTHVHYIDGVMVVHSHPAKNKNHTHTPAQVVLLSSLSSFHTPKAEFVLPFREVERPLLYVIKTFHEVPYVKGIFLESLSLRAPPVHE